ncbi:MAG TPA: hypothetical protein VMJ32_12015 [Pirellulales bacterium]|nr:hypothetical protein [Pirellulales bacterium]
MAPNIHVLQPPTLSYTPVSPRVSFNFAVGLGLDLVAAVVVMAVGEQRRREHLARESSQRASITNGSSRTLHAVGATNGEGGEHNDSLDVDLARTHIVQHPK